MFLKLLERNGVHENQKSGDVSAPTSWNVPALGEKIVPVSWCSVTTRTGPAQDKRMESEEMSTAKVVVEVLQPQALIGIFVDLADLPLGFADLWFEATCGGQDRY